MSSLVPPESPRRCRPGFLQLDWPGCWRQAELPLWLFPHFFSPISRHLFSKSNQQLHVFK
ncbi:hypothetical protein N338_06855, partial [Podiceps cristatus]